MRGRIRRKRIRRDYVYFLAPVAVAMVVAFILSNNADVLAAAWRDPRHMIDERSPGDRDPGALYAIKPERVAALIRPKERVLPTIRERFGPVEIPFVDLDLDLDIDPALDPTPLTFSPPIDPFVPSAPPLPTEPVAPRAVPEPATWLTNIIGLFAIAGVMRHRRWRRRRAALIAAA